jgi:AcrR family transcriptional regulator
MLLESRARHGSERDLVGTTGRRRLRTEDRREQIINVTLASVAERGVTGTTLARIAASVEVTPQALYAHFANRRELLLAALDVVFARIRANHRDFACESALERLREIGLRHTRLVASSPDGLVSSYFEFIAAPPKEGLRSALKAGNSALIEDLAEIVREGQRDGTIIKEADPYQVAWLMTSRAWTEDVVQLMGATDQWNEARSMQMLDTILGSITAHRGES